jgi:sulfate adenylyltransferase
MIQAVFNPKNESMSYKLTDAIAPHGGELINRVTTAAQKTEFLSKAESLPRVSLDERAVSDLQMIAIGGFSPLKGFMGGLRQRCGQYAPE